jgi:hypothetical protein
MNNKRFVTHTYEGKCLGKKLSIKHFLRQSTEEDVKPDVLLWGENRLILDYKSIPSVVWHLHPIGSLTPRCTAAHWEKFVNAANVRMLFS